MTEMTDDELIAFLRSNKERVKAFIESEIPELVAISRREVEEDIDTLNETAKKVCDDVKEKAEEIRGEVKDFIEEQKEANKDDESRMKQNFREFTDAFTNTEVQRHFVRMGMEFLLGMSAFIEAMPKPDFVEEAMEKAEEARKTASREYCATNEDCPRKKAVKKIELD